MGGTKSVFIKPKIEYLKVKSINGTLANVAINDLCVTLTERKGNVIFSLEMPLLSSITTSTYLSI